MNQMRISTTLVMPKKLEIRKKNVKIETVD
jgi:hypothetical protein